MHKEVFSFAIQLKAARSLVGWSQAELAARTGVARPTIARIEALTMQPRLDTVGKLKRAFLDAGLQMLDGEPVGGFSLVMTSEALQSIMEMHRTRQDTTSDGTTKTGRVPEGFGSGARRQNQGKS
ncbi:helix-turn-helix domain-containing protein [Denitratisoma sp. DHT3]|uniref:helix-turn-helix domain-containing protein n=1 Tax=Denitratisoma sp. DHT3 TaxID=1981880 RepID=UPI001C98B314|nr:helix-turn-helix domain-containing protein [Denitratisoma sp. DHT3]